MEDKELQVENGNFTRIINPVLEELVKIPFKGCELAVAIFIIRKTWGFNKPEDEISLTQFELGLQRSRPTIVASIKNLQLVNIVKLVKQGNSKLHSNLYRLNKYVKTWTLVNTVKLVKRSTSTSKAEVVQLVKAPLHTKDNTKDNTKERTFSPPSLEEVSEYCTNRANGIDPEHWINFYESKGWMIGKNKMKDWRAAVRTWEQRNPKPKDTKEQEAINLVKECGGDQELAMHKMISKYGGSEKAEILKYKHIFGL